MKRMMILALLASGWSQGAGAQLVWTDAHIGAREADPLFRSREASAAAYCPLDYAGISLGGAYAGGSFHRPQQPREEYMLRFDSEGGRQLDRFYLKGGFTFRETFQRDVQFATTLDPLRGMPYTIADTTGGNWQKQRYDLWAQAACPFGAGKGAAGLGAEIAVGRGAKRVDPRPQANANRITLRPSLSWNAEAAGILSMSFIYRLSKENSDLLLYDTSVPQKVYLLKGMGQYTYEIFSAAERERKFEGNGIGTGMNYVMKKDSLALSFSGEYVNFCEEACDIDYSKPHLRGRVYSDTYEISGGLFYRSLRSFHEFTFGCAKESSSGREYVQVFNPAPDVNAWVTDSELPGRCLRHSRNIHACYQLWAGRPWRWHLTADCRMESCSENYPAMASFMEYKAFCGSLLAERLFSLPGKGHLRTGLAAGYRRAYDSRYAYVEREADDHTIKGKLLDPDFAILTAETLSAEASILYFLPLRDSSRGLWFRVAGGYLCAAASSLSRISASFTLGVSL